MKNKSSRFAMLAQELDLPEDLGKDGYRIEIYKNTVVIDGCRNVAEYGDGIIRINAGRVCVRVAGSGLTIKSFSCSQIVINGFIISVELG